MNIHALDGLSTKAQALLSAHVHAGGATPTASWTTTAIADAIHGVGPAIASEILSALLRAESVPAAKADQWQEALDHALALLTERGRSRDVASLKGCPSPTSDKVLRAIAILQTLPGQLGQNLAQDVASYVPGEMT